MNTESDILSRLHDVIRSLESMRDEISATLTVPECDNGVSASDRAHLEGLHRRIAISLTALHSEARER